MSFFTSRCEELMNNFERRNTNDLRFLINNIVSILKWALLVFHIFLVYEYATTTYVTIDGIVNLAIFCHGLEFVSNVIPLIAGVTMKKRLEIIKFSERFCLTVIFVFALMLLVWIQIASGMKDIPNDYSKFVAMDIETVLIKLFTHNLTSVEALSVIVPINFIMSLIAFFFILQDLDKNTSTIHNTDEETGLATGSSFQAFSPVKSRVRKEPNYGSFTKSGMSARTNGNLFTKNFKPTGDFEVGRISEHPSLENFEFCESSNTVNKNLSLSENLDDESHKRKCYDNESSGELTDSEESSQEDSNIDIEEDMSPDLSLKMLEELETAGKNQSRKETGNIGTDSQQTEGMVYDPQRYDKQEVLGRSNVQRKKYSKLSKEEKIL